MKYQFTTEGSKPQTKYHQVKVINKETAEVLFETYVSTPLPWEMLHTFLNNLLEEKPYPELSVRVGHVFTYEDKPSNIDIIGLDSIARIITNIKPLKIKAAIYINGEKKFFSIDADKLDTFLKSLE